MHKTVGVTVEESMEFYCLHFSQCSIYCICGGFVNSVFFCRNLGNCMTRKKKAKAAPVTRYSLRMLGVLYVVDKQPISVLEHSSLKVMLVHCETSNADVSACCQFQINCTAL